MDVGTRITGEVVHRMSRVCHAVRIFGFLGGRIVEAGSYRELLA